MNVLLIVLSTIVLSFSIELLNEMTIFKEIANRGYKIDMNKASKYANKKEQQMFLVKMIIPGVNIVEAFKRMNKYEKAKSELFANLDKIDLFVKMTDEEYQQYIDRPKSTTALNLAIALEDKKELPKKEPIKQTGYIKISNGTYRHEFGDGTYTEILFKKENGKAIVTSMKGKITELSPKEQQEELDKIFKTLYKQKAIIEEEKSQTTIKKEQLIAHREEVLASQKEDNQMKLSLK